MKIAFLCSHPLAVPTLEQLASQRKIMAVGLPRMATAEIHHMQQVCSHLGLPCRLLDEIEFMPWLQEYRPDAVMVMGFPIRIPEDVLKAVPKGFFNFHFGKLPEYRGPQPIFWQLLANEKQAVISVHQMDKKFDRGPMVLEVPVAKHPEDTFGMLRTRYAMHAPQAALQLVELLTNNQLKPMAQNEAKAAYQSKAAAKDLVIRWSDMNAENILGLIRATNPWNYGAYTRTQYLQFRIIQATMVNAGSFPDADPGTVVIASQERGVIIKCKDKKLIRLEIVHLEEGIFGGQMLMGFGVKEGDKMVDV